MQMLGQVGNEFLQLQKHSHLMQRFTVEFQGKKKPSAAAGIMLGPKKPGDASRWLSAGRVLKASKDGVFSIKPGGVDMSFSSVSIDSVMPSKLIRSDQESIYWSCIVDASESSISGCLPAVAKFKSLGNVVILDAKQTPIGTYIHGLLQDNLMKWNPPRKATDTVEEDGILSLWRVPNEDVEEFKNGVDIEADVRAMIDKLIAHLPSFNSNYCYNECPRVHFRVPHTLLHPAYVAESRVQSTNTKYRAFEEPTAGERVCAVVVQLSD